MLATAPPPLRTLVLDAHSKHALAAVRSLGRRGNMVTAVSHAPHARAFTSRYTTSVRRSPDPGGQRGDFVRWLIETLRRGRYDALLFFDEATADVVSAYHGTVQIYTGCAMPARETFLEAQARPSGNGASNADDVYVLTALVRRGEPVASFLHRAPGRSIAEPAGAPPPTVVSADHAEIRQLGFEHLRGLEWHGLASLTFGVGDDVPRLLALRPICSEGLELAIAAGVDVPWLYAQLAAGRPITGPTRYRVGLRFRRLLEPNALRHPPAYVLHALATLWPRTRTDISLRDPRPDIQAVLRGARRLRTQLLGLPRSLVRIPSAATSREDAR
ncbi:MAG: hypothetical protein JSW67_05415 [Candidatus Latescibacterota bacterium]|nr:MAG: hypothetical protein JSW67_05415 [Candidatus Latescibacterota bacterium]